MKEPSHAGGYGVLKARLSLTLMLDPAAPLTGKESD